MYHLPEQEPRDAHLKLLLREKIFYQVTLRGLHLSPLPALSKTAPFCVQSVCAPEGFRPSSPRLSRGQERGEDGPNHPPPPSFPAEDDGNIHHSPKCRQPLVHLVLCRLSSPLHLKGMDRAFFMLT